MVDVQFEDGWYNVYDSKGNIVDGFDDYVDAVSFALYIEGTDEC